MNEEVNGSDTDDYDPNSSSSDSKYEDFDESDCDLKEDDALFELNVDQEIEDSGVEITGGSDDEGSDELGELDDEDSDELESLNSSSDSDDDNKVFKAKKRVITMVEGPAAEQFLQLFGYIEEVRSSNPGTTIKLTYKPVPGFDNEVKFKRLYICWRSLKRGFLEGCRPVIGLVWCHLKGPHGGIMLTAIGLDANNCIYPFAYATVEKEKKTTWLWFLELLRDDLDVQNSHSYIFMTDKQKGLVDAVGELFPNAGHRFCVDSERVELLQKVEKGVLNLCCGGGIGTTFVIDKSHAVAPVFDLAILKVEAECIFDTYEFTFGENLPVGSSIFSLGHGDAFNLFRAGMVSSAPIHWNCFSKTFRRPTSVVINPPPEDLTVENMDMGTARGSSGSPVFGLDGKVIAVVKCGTTDDLDMSTFFVSARHVVEFLRLYRVGLLKSRNFGAPITFLSNPNTRDPEEPLAVPMSIFTKVRSSGGGFTTTLVRRLKVLLKRFQCIGADDTIPALNRLKASPCPRENMEDPTGRFSPKVNS
ncbi:hypothetical protein Vadar_007766 [Vaccinium darrowii]|uniref:Uncharacterized protein n=1 Tax=Vaccinium darrowii TaxID=229202 RepID=A0ACB7X8T8_9ERIC|nr:hypothetical protein Vadar_007766 [Vaccinium darrowii]